MRVKIIERPTGYVRIGDGNLGPWPEVGEVVDLPDIVAEGMIATGQVEKAAEPKVEKRPASRKGAETRKAKD